MVSNSEPVAIQISGLNKWFGDHQVLKDITLSIKKDERIVICGPSGSGKSTLIRCLNYLEKFQQGNITINDMELTDHRKRKDQILSDVSMVFQQYNLFPHLTILENCMLGPVYVQNCSRKKAQETAMHYLDRVKIPEQAGKYPHQLSGGQQQRVAIARSLCMKPKIMLFDEPTSALDPEMVNEVLEILISLAEEGTTMICVTHEMGFARQAANRILFMDEGMIVEQNTPDQFFSNPQHERTKTFLSQIL